jgi:3-phosphoshikimate 1-carboxyvinyltransferase
MADALRALGAAVLDDGDDWVVTGSAEPLRPAVVDCGNAGTVARFVLAAAGLAAGEVTLDGDPRMRMRPLAPLVGALRALGADVVGDALPVTVRGTGRVRGGSATVDASASSQFVSALLLAGPRFDGGVTVRTPAAVPSAPHVAMTITTLRAAGAQVTSGPGWWTAAAGPLAAMSTTVEPDLSGAAPFLAAAAVTGGRVVIPGWPVTTDQPGALLLPLLTQIGARCDVDGSRLEVSGTAALQGFDVDLGPAGELTPVVAALAALASSPSRIRGVAHLRGHETDRLAALASELNRLGGSAEETDDGLVVEPRPLRAGVWRTYDDHRMAMAGAVLGLVVEGVVLDDVATTRKTMPDFVDRWAAMVTG